MEQKLSILFVFCLALSINLQGQWTVIPGTEGLLTSNIAVSDGYLFFDYFEPNTWDDIDAFIRIDLNNDFESKVMVSTNGQPFNQFGWKRLVTSGEHILYSAQQGNSNKLFISHNYGSNWQNTTFLSSPSLELLANEDQIFVSNGIALLLSEDGGDQFEQIFPLIWSDDNIRPLLSKDDWIYIGSERELTRINLVSGAYEILDERENFLYKMVTIGDTLIGSTTSMYGNNIFRSFDSGFTWEVINEGQFEDSSISDLQSRGSWLFADVGSSLLVSFDYGENYFDLTQNLPGGSYVRGFALGEDDVYISTSTGIYSRKLSSIVPSRYSGTVYLDSNENGVRDLGEKVLEGVKLHLEGKNYVSFSDSNGEYDIEYLGSATKLSLLLEEDVFQWTPEYCYSEEISFQQDFGVKGDSTYHDTSVFLSPHSELRPGFETIYSVTLWNRSLTKRTDTVLLNLADNVQFLSAEGAVLELTGNSLSGIVELAPFEETRIQVRCSLPPDVDLLGDLAESKATFAFNNDARPNDNRDSIEQVIVGSYDPNDKQVRPSGDIQQEFIENGEWLDYLIRFQNTGTAVAEQVVVKDQLDDLLDPLSIRIVGSSHDYEVQIDSLNELSFTFANIFLPDSTSDEVNSHGFIRFLILPKSNMQEGEFISNEARIFFDFNPPIITNTTVTYLREPEVETEPGPEVVETDTIQEAATYQILPNPNNGRFNIDVKANSSIHIYDLSGKSIPFTREEVNGQTLVDVLYEYAGIYFVQIVGEDQIVHTRRIILVNQ